MAKLAAQREAEDGLAIRAAWLHYAGGLTQAEVAARLNISTVKANRLVNWANRNGAVKVSIVGEVAECAMLETRVAERFGLSYCEVVPELYEPGLPLRALGTAGAAFLQREIATLGEGVVGLGHGRTLAAAAAALPRFDAGNVRFVSLLGGLTRNFSANPYDVMHRLAERTGAAAYVMPLPFFANTSGDKEVLLAQRGVADIFDLAANADLMVVGIGTAQPDAQLVSSDMIKLEEIGEVQQRGGVGEMIGHFFDKEGRVIETSLTARTIAADLHRLTGRRIVALAGGMGKVQGIRAVLKSGFLQGLITDERTARALAGEDIF